MISDLPRYALETIAFGGIVLIVIYLLASGQNIAQALPLIGLYAFSGVPADARPATGFYGRHDNSF